MGGWNGDGHVLDLGGHRLTDGDPRVMQCIEGEDRAGDIRLEILVFNTDGRAGVVVAQEGRYVLGLHEWIPIDRLVDHQSVDRSAIAELLQLDLFLRAA